MEQAEHGTIITDLGKSLPTLEDFFYNDLEGYDTSQLPNDASTIFYQEAPPQSAEYLGISPDGSLLTIKLPKEAFDINLRSIVTNAISGNGIRVDLSKAEYDGYDNIKAMLEQFKADPQLAGYYTTVGADNEDLFKRNGMAFAANLRLLYTNMPEIPRFTSTEVPEQSIARLSYSKVKNLRGTYHFSTMPYPYTIKYSKQDDETISASFQNYDKVDLEVKTQYADTDLISFVEKNGAWYQVIELDRKRVNRYDKGSGDIRNVLVLQSDNDNVSGTVRGYTAKNDLIQEIQSAKDIRLVLDINSLNSQASSATYLTEYPLEYSNGVQVGDFTNYIRDLYNNLFDYRWYKYAGYVPYGLDKYHRIAGVIYVQKEVKNADGKTELVWYNLNKKLIADANNAESPVSDSVTSPTDRYHIGYGPAALKPYTYNYANKCYVDRFWREAGENEDRRRAVQKKIFEDTKLINLFPEGSGDYATDDDVLYRWTVSIGDVTFFIPPESIRVVSQTDTIRVPVMRARGTIAKGRERSMQYLELNLYFNEDRGINGVSYESTSPNGEQKFTYRMNGFRALLAQMKFTPFLPIVNKHINEDLGIYAVCIENIELGTVPGFPKLLRARILLSKFNYQVYMPEIPLPANDSSVSSERRNPFSACIDYDTMRWYYQRCIMLGDELDRLLNEEDKARRITVNSLEFYTRTIFANRTALLPCHFMDPNISVYIADEDHLKTLLQIKQDAMKKSLNVSDNYNPTENEARLIKEVAQLASKVSIGSIYAKYASLASILLPALDRARNTGKEEVTDDNRGSRIVIDGDTIQYRGKMYNIHYTADTDQFLNACIYNPMRNEFSAAFQNLKNEDDRQIVDSVKISGNAIVIQINHSYILNPDLRNTARESTVYLKRENPVLSIDPDNIFDNAQIALKLAYTNSISPQYSEDCLRDALLELQGYYGSSSIINPNADIYASLNFLDWCLNTGKGIIDANDEASRLKQSIDYEDVHTMKYNLILENALVTQFSASVANTYARIGVTGVDGSAPQYMGGQDTHLSWTIETKDASIASTFKSLPELTAYYTRTYRKVLPTYPIKIDSEFTRMMGVMEITLDNVVVTTVENFPGLYRIVVNATSVDRTLRNKEAFKLLELKGQTQGLEDSRKKTQVNIRYAKELDAAFSEAEVYPDLELPKISELGKLGWRFIRYRVKERNKEEFYVDPDFYFVYPGLTVGRAIIESLRCTFDEELRGEVSEEDITQTFTDTSGQQRSVGLNGGIKRKEMNQAAEESLKDMQVQKVNAVKQDRLYYMDALKSVIMRMPVGSLDVGNRIRCVFTEPYYIKEYRWMKNEADIPNEKVLEIKVDDGNQETLEKAAETAGPDYARIQFVLKNSGKVINTMLNPNWKDADSQKVAGLLDDFVKCGQALDEYLAKNDDSLATNGEAETDEEKVEAALATLKTYDASLISNYLTESGFWTLMKKYKVFGYANISEIITEENTRYFVKDNKVNFDVLSDEQEATAADLAYLIQAVGDVLSAQEECSSKNKTKGFGIHPWQANLSKPRVINGTVVSDLEEAIDKPGAYSFGVFGIKKYTFSQLYRILPKNEQEELEKSFADDPDQFFVLDPYFRTKSADVKKRYLRNCAVSSAFCATAFMRIVLWYLAKLLEYQVIPSIEFDVKRQDNINAADANEAANKFLEERGIKKQSASTLFTQLREFAKNNGQAFDTGKFFAAILLALTEEGFGKNTIFDMYNTRNYDELNHIISSVTSLKYKARNENDPTFFERNTRIRKYLLALYGYGIIEDPNNINKNVQASPASKFLTDYNTKIALEACGKPAQYMRDSFYDMIRNDYRGRMLRAFPTFYMVFADEGREIGLWKLHDNFYNMNAIHEIQIVKSRKIPADTCKIVLSNMFQTFTTNDEDCTINYKGNFGDLWASFLNPKEEATKEELKRLAAKKINRAKLQTGVRIHVRMGYGANAADLPCCFNGVIADIKPGELVEIVAQGDGVELCNPIYMEADADTVQNNDNWATMDKCVCGAPPKDILQGFLTAKGGPMAAWLRNQYRNGFFGTGFTAESAANKLAEENAAGNQFWARNLDQDSWLMYGLLHIFEDNPYGLRHFGDPAYRAIFAQGEPAQNLYEVTNKSQTIWDDFFGKENTNNKAYFGDGALDLDDDINGWSGYNDHNDLLHISFKPYGRTVWDIMHICKSVAPDYMTGIADFQFRSTIFLGKPHYYYAYKYAYLGDGKTAYEKRKPFQQWHLYNNFSDIVTNKISASSEKMKTNAIGTYEVECISGMKKTAPMWVDQDIYSEYQKSMVVDTKLYGKSWVKHNAITGTIGAIPGIGWITDNILDVVSKIPNDLMDENCATMFDKRGSVEAHSSIAEDAVIDALKNSVKEMYQGYMIVLGDPSVKPNDRIQINDAYEDMSGICEVREVVHTMNLYNGFTTTLTPDAISCHDLKNEILKVSWGIKLASRVGTGLTLALSGAYFGPRLYAKGQKVVDESFKTTKALGKAGIEDLKSLTKTIKETLQNTNLWKTATETKTTQTGKTALNALKSAGKSITSPASKQVTSILEKIGLKLIKNPNATKTLFGAGAAKTMAAVAGGTGTAIAGTAAAAVVVPALVAAGAFAIVGSTINTAIYRKIKGMQTLYIFPLRKFGKAFIAGLDGQQGLVYGTMQFNQPGPIEQLVGRYLAHSPEDASIIKKFIRGMFIDDQIMELADKWDPEQNDEFLKAAHSGSQKLLSEADVQSIGGPQLDKAMYQPNSAYMLSLMPRTMVDGIQRTWSPTVDKNKETIWQAVRNRYYIDNIKTWTVNPNLRNLVYLEDNLQLKYFFESGFLRTLPQAIMENKNNDSFNKDNLLAFPIHMPKGESKQVIGVKRIEEQKTGKAVVLDVPYSSIEGLTIIREICKMIHHNTPYLTKPDMRENDQQNKDTSIVISSALVVGSKNPFYGSGFHLILTGIGELGKDGILKKYVQDYYNILKDQLKPASYNYEHLPLFRIEDMTKTNEVGIEIGVPSPFCNNIAALTINEEKGTLTPKNTDIEVNNTNEPLDESSFTQHVYYSPLDEYQRCGRAYAKITYNDVVAARQKVRQSLGAVFPSGWKYIPTAIEDGEQKTLYDRCHLIAHSLEGEEANMRNLITGTKDFNERMYTYEKKVQDYLSDHMDTTVLYQVTPVYNGSNLVASYVIMEATDLNKGTSIFNVSVYNTDPKWIIDYKTGNAKRVNAK